MNRRGLLGMLVATLAATKAGLALKLPESKPAIPVDPELLQQVKKLDILIKRQLKRAGYNG